MKELFAGIGLSRWTTTSVLALVIAVAAIAEPQFLTTANLFNLSRQVGPNLIVATGMAVVIIAEGSTCRSGQCCRWPASSRWPHSSSLDPG